MMNDGPTFVSREKMTFSYRPKDLMSVSSFVSYCKKRGIDTSEEQLEYYDKYNLLLPVVCVHPGFVEFRKVFADFGGQKEWRFTPSDNFDATKYEKVEDQKYYSYGGIHIGYEDPITGEDWLQYYIKTSGDMVLFPAKQRFRDWKTYLGKETTSEFVTDTDQLGNKYHMFYSEFQAYLLQEIQKTVKVSLDDGLIFNPDANWQRVGKNIQELLPTLISAAQQKVTWYYDVITLLYEILALKDKLCDHYQKKFSEGLKVWGDRHEAAQEAKHAMKVFEHDELPRCAKEVVNKLGLTIDGISEKRIDIVMSAKWLDPTKRFFDHMETLPSEAINRSEGILRLVMDYYYLADEIGWFLQLLGQTPPTIKKLVWGNDKTRPCVICHELFTPGDIRQITCSKECSKENKKIKIEEKQRIQRLVNKNKH